MRFPTVVYVNAFLDFLNETLISERVEGKILRVEISK